ncbi:MAG: response regulator [Chitinophagaceae bacterium]
MCKYYTIYIADDHNIVAKGIEKIIKQIEGVKDVYIFVNGKELFDACEIQMPDAVFLDIDMPVWDGRKTLIALKKQYPKLKCLMLSMNNEKTLIDDCIENGANGYLNKDCTEAELEEAIFTNEAVYLSKEVLKNLSGYSKKIDNKSFKLQGALTERELDILSLLCDGLSPKEIADKIFLSPRTVETHKKNIMEKFDVTSIGKLISIALKNSIIK